jgi:hypothetical protein
VALRLELILTKTLRSDDPWNQTAADNAEWLRRFKRHCGLVTDGGPGLSDGPEWAVEQGGSGFAPPYAYPKSQHEPFETDVQIVVHSEGKQFPAGQSAANGYLQDLKFRYPRPAVIFCSRELELGLVSFVKAHIQATGQLPSTEAVRTEGKRIHDYKPSPMDDAALVGKFQQWMTRKFPGAASPSETSTTSENEGESEPFFMPANMDVNISDEELGNILQDMDFDLQDQQMGQGAEPDGGVSLAMFQE